MSYTIGLYNEKVDNPSNLSNCDIICKDFETAVNSIKDGDKLLLSSALSCFDTDFTDILDLISNNKIEVQIIGNNRTNKTAMGRLELQIIFNSLEFIKTIKTEVYTLLKNELGEI